MQYFKILAMILAIVIGNNVKVQGMKQKTALKFAEGVSYIDTAMWSGFAVSVVECSAECLREDLCQVFTFHGRNGFASPRY